MIGSFLLFSALLSGTTQAFVPSNVLSLNKKVATISQRVKFLSTPTTEIPNECTRLMAGLTTAELPEKLYFEKEKEIPKVLGGLQIGLRKLVVITGASSGLGLKCAATLAKTGRYFVVMAVRDVEKGKRVAKQENMPQGSYTVMKLELGNLQSVRDFVANLKAFKSARPLSHLICNAAVYKPTDPEPAWTDDGFEMSMVRKWRCSLFFLEKFFALLNIEVLFFPLGREPSWTLPSCKPSH